MTANLSNPPEALWAPGPADALLRRVDGGLRAILLACAVVLVIAWLLTMAFRVLHYDQLDYVEGAHLYNALRVSRGEPLYPSTDELPYVPTAYGPVFLNLWALMARFSGPVFWPGRLIASVGGLLVAVCLYLLTVRLSGDRFAGLLAVAIWASASPVTLWSGLARVDLLALGLSLGGLLLATHQSPRAQWAAVFLLVVAFFTKQSSLAPPVTLLIWRSFSGQRRLAVAQFGGWALLCMAVGLVLVAATRGAALRDLIAASASEYIPEAAMKAFTGFCANHKLMVLLAGTTGLLLLPRPTLRLLPLYALFSGLTALYIGAVGSAANHFLELTAALALLCGLGASGQGIVANCDPRRLLVTLLLLSHLVPRLSAADPAKWHLPAEDPVMREVRAAVASKEGPILSERMGPLAQAGKTVWVDPFVTAQMALAGRWDQGSLVEMIRRQQFALIVIGSDWRYFRRHNSALPHGPMFTWEQLQAMKDGYVEARRVGNWHLLVPRGAQRGPMR